MPYLSLCETNLTLMKTLNEILKKKKKKFNKSKKIILYNFFLHTLQIYYHLFITIMK